MGTTNPPGMQEFLTYTGPPENDLNPRVGIASSYHSGGVNATFVDGHVVFLNEQMEPLVYAQLMTSNHKQSDLGVAPQYESQLAEPADGSF
jgi:prepilin-type processing-associated H-X9-DG protein